MNARVLTSTTLASLCALALSGAPVQAAVTHNYISRITEVPTEGPQGKHVPAPGPLIQPRGLTVDSSELYVADRFENSRLDKFDASSGAFVSQFVQLPPPAYDLRQSVAVGHETGEAETYVIGDERGSTEIEGLVAVFGPTGALQAVWKGTDTPSKAFNCFDCGAPGGIAVDSSTSLAQGDVYVSVPTHGVVDVFKPEPGGGETYVTQLTGPESGVSFSDLSGVAVNPLSGDVLVLDGEEVDVFEPTALSQYTLVRRLTGTPRGLFGRLGSIAVDGGNGDIYVTEGGGGIIDQFDSEGVYLGHMAGVGTPAGAFGGVAGVAVDPVTHNVYVVDSNNEGAFVDIFGPGVVVPGVASGPVSGVKTTSATLNGTVNPADAGPATCRFEWGTSTEFGNVAPCEPEGVSDGGSSVAVHATLSGLQLDTIYHYRLQASNVNGTNRSEAFQDQEFTTLGPSLHGEWVTNVGSTSAALNAKITPNGTATSYFFQYGRSASYESRVPVPDGSAGAGSGEVRASVLLEGLAPSRLYHYRIVAVSEPGGEPVTVDGPDLTFTTYPPSGQASLPDNRVYELVSPSDKNSGDVGGGAFNGQLATGLGQSAASGNAVTYLSLTSFGDAMSAALTTQYLSSRTSDGWTTHAISPPASPSAEFSFTLTSYHFFTSDLSAGLLDWTKPTLVSGAPEGFDNLYVQGINSGSYQLVTTVAPPGRGPASYGVTFAGASPDLSHVVFEANAALTAGAPAQSQSLYEWSGGTLRLVSVLPGLGNTAAASAGAGAGGDNIFANDVATDGSRIFWTDNNEQLYVRENAATTVKLSSSQRTPSLGDGSATFRAATPDGSKVFFTDGTALTNDPNDNGGGIYEYDFENGRLIDVTPHSGVAPGIEGVVGVGNDGSSLYFVATQKLASEARTGSDNLYVAHNNTITFIATLSGNDSNDWTQSFVDRTAKVTPDGEHVVFMSHASLTGYDNVDANTGNPDTEVFVYSLDAGHLSCASCNPSGEPPIGPSSLPGVAHSVYVPGSISSNGSQVFFDSNDALVPVDTNGQQDVYEYENGKVSLISTGSSEDISAFVDASPNGESVFFTTRARLVSQDQDSNADMYDARVGGGFSPSAVAPVPCSAEACRGPLSASPIPLGVATAGFTVAPEEATSLAVAKRATKKPKRRKHPAKRRARKAKRHAGSKRRARMHTQRTHR
jgi:hypothetical protein